MNLQPFRQLRRVYCAGALFNAAERYDMEEIAKVLVAAGYEPFLPHRDGMEFSQVLPYLVANGHDPAAVGQLLHEAIFALDAYQVVGGCGSLVCNLNGRVPDEGAVSEAAMAWMLGKPIVMFKEDCRSMVAGRDNPLVVGLTEFKVVRTMDAIPTALRARIAELQVQSDHTTVCPPHLERMFEQGRQLSEQLAALGDSRPADQVALIIRELFDPTGARLATPRSA